MKTDYITVSEIAQLVDCSLPHLLLTTLREAGMNPRRHAIRGLLVIDRDDWQKHAARFWQLLPSESPGAA